MFRKSKRTPLRVWQVGPPPSPQFQINTGSALVSPGQIWFRPETIILDAIYMVDDILWLWRSLTKLVSLFALRAALIAGVIFLISSVSQTSNLAAANNLAAASSPITEDVKIVTKIKASPSLVFRWPIRNRGISTYFSYYHRGIDLPANYGAGVKPFAVGTVSKAGWDGGFGYTVAIRHPKGYVTRYSHLSRINVRIGQKVGPNTIIGRIGSTGYATGPHLHFEVYKAGVAINPLLILR